MLRTRRPLSGTRPAWLGTLLLPILLLTTGSAWADSSPLTVVKTGGKYYAGVPTKSGKFQPWFETLFLGFEMRGRVQYHHFGGEGVDLLQRFLVANTEAIPEFPAFHFRVDRAEVEGKPITQEQIRRGIQEKGLPPLEASVLSSPELGETDQVLVYSPDLKKPEEIREFPVCVAPTLEARKDWRGLECFWVYEGTLLDSFRTRMIPQPFDASEMLRVVEPELRQNFLEKRSLWSGESDPRHFLRIEAVQVPSENESEREAVFRLRVGKRELGAVYRYFFGRYLVYSGGDPHLGFDPVAISLSTLSEEEQALATP